MSTKEQLVSDGMMSVEEAMKFLDVSRSHLYELMDKRLVPWAKIGRSRRIPRRALVEYVAANLKGVDAVGILNKG